MKMRHTHPMENIIDRRALTALFSEVNILLKKGGVSKAETRITDFAHLLFLKLMSERDQGVNFSSFSECKSQNTWERLRTLKLNALFYTLNTQILPALVQQYPKDDIFNARLHLQKPDILKKIVDKISKFNFGGLDSDILGDAVEYFLHNGSGEKSAMGAYFTPRHIVNLMLDLVQPKAGQSVYDPTCGAGGLLTQALRYIQCQLQVPLDEQAGLAQQMLFGCEIAETIKIAKMNLILLDASPKNLRQQDSLQYPVHHRHEVVLANFPFSQKTDYGARYGLKGNDANPIFLKHIIEALAPQGMAAVIVPDTLLQSEQNDYRSARKTLLENCELLAVIRLHAFVFRA